MEHGVKKIKSLEELKKHLDKCTTPIVGKILLTMYDKFINNNYNKVLCSISGGSDSDIILDLCSKFIDNNKITYTFFDTGLEYKATKEHLVFLENKYNINIERIQATTPIPISCKKKGQPFLSKHVSEMINRLQKHEFKWEDKPFNDLIKEYPNCKSALEWWCNTKPSPSHNIKQNKLLKEFIINNNPWFKISQYCCEGAKKKPLKKMHTDNNFDIDISGVRKSEGGVRARAYASCFTLGDKYDTYRPIFYMSDKDKLEYRKMYNISNSKCYTLYGLKRTGCIGCPFNRDFEYELNIVSKYEPKLYVAVNSIFKDSYEYTRMYNEFKKEVIK